MKWEEAVLIFKIDKIYRSASLENATLLPSEIVEFGKKWLLSRTNSLLLCGNYGSGKTYFSICLLKELIKAGDWVIFIKSSDLEAELLSAITENIEQDVLRKYCEATYLFIDDLGAERMSDRVIRQYQYIIDYRTANELTTIITSNYGKSHMQTVYGPRIASRFEYLYEIKFPNTDLRKKISLTPV